MRAVLDTNVLVSGIYFGGQPRLILTLALERIWQPVWTPAIFGEYQRATGYFPGLKPGVFGTDLLVRLEPLAHVVNDRVLPYRVCRDQDDDKFLACALAAGRVPVVTGDKALLATDGYEGISVISVRTFIGQHLKGKP